MVEEPLVIRSHHHQLMSLRFWNFYGCLFLAMTAIVGCGDGRIKTYPVTGKILVDGQPATKAMVIFCPTGGTEEMMKKRPFDETDGGGVFNLTTFSPADGAPAGDYNVIVRWPAPKNERRQPTNPEDDIHGDRSLPRAVDQLRGRYFHPERSGLKATVTKGRNELAPFELEAPPQRRR